MRPLPKIRFGIRVQDVPMDWGMGFVLTIGITAMILISLPEARVLFALSLPTGIILGLILYLIHRRPPRRERIISLNLGDAPDHRPVLPHNVTHPRTPPASGIRMERISRAGEMGLVFTIGALAAMAMILISFPEAHELFCMVVSRRNHSGPHSIPDSSPSPTTRKDHVPTFTGRARSPGRRVAAVSAFLSVGSSRARLGNYNCPGGRKVSGREKAA